MGYNCVIQVFSKTSVVRNVSCDESLGGDRRREGGREGKGKDGEKGGRKGGKKGRRGEIKEGKALL